MGAKINLPEIKSTKIQIQKLGKLDYAKLLVACALIEKSVSQTGQTAIYTYLSRNWPQHEERLQVEANSRGISLEEAFIELLNESLN